MAIWSKTLLEALVKGARFFTLIEGRVQDFASKGCKILHTEKKNEIKE